jgi:hypothetical protein
MLPCDQIHKVVNGRGGYSQSVCLDFSGMDRFSKLIQHEPLRISQRCDALDPGNALGIATCEKEITGTANRSPPPCSSANVNTAYGGPEESAQWLWPIAAPRPKPGTAAIGASPAVPKLGVVGVAGIDRISQEGLLS